MSQNEIRCKCHIPAIIKKKKKFQLIEFLILRHSLAHQTLGVLEMEKGEIP